MKVNIETWRKYIDHHFQADRPEDLPQGNSTTGPQITIPEVERAISLIKDGKAVGLEEFHGKF